MKLTQSLFPEVFQTEQSAEEHCAREAKRLVERPAAAMIAVSDHARASLTRLHAFAEKRDVRTSTVGKVVGHLFSEVRERLADHFVSSELSYRGTLLGIRHGVDLFRLLGEAAQNEGDAELAELCSSWLAARAALTANVEAQLAWFAAHPEDAMKRAV